MQLGQVPESITKETGWQGSGDSKVQYREDGQIELQGRRTRLQTAGRVGRGSLRLREGRLNHESVSIEFYT